MQTRPWWPAISIAILGGQLTLRHYYWLSQQSKQKDTLKLTRVTQTNASNIRDKSVEKTNKQKK